MKKKILRHAVGAMKETGKRTLKRFDPLGTGVGVVAGANVSLPEGRNKDAKRIKKCGKKYKVDPKDTHSKKMEKLRKFNKCRSKQ